jgi:hypothetical protein
MSHSQFHSTNLFILRHAWLNLWDKHMTTGRINQVAVVKKTFISGRKDLEVLTHNHINPSKHKGFSYEQRLKREFFKMHCKSILEALRPIHPSVCKQNSSWKRISPLSSTEGKAVECFGFCRNLLVESQLKLIKRAPCEKQRKFFHQIDLAKGFSFKALQGQISWLHTNDHSTVPEKNWSKQAVSKRRKTLWKEKLNKRLQTFLQEV